jgi:hypothetical protein
MAHRIKYGVFVCLVTLFAVSCTPDKKPLDIPTTYDGAAFSTNAATQLAVLTRFSALVSEAQKGRIVGTVVSYNTLTNLYNTGTPSLKSITTPYFAGRLDSPGGWMDELAKSSGTGYTLGTPVGQGGAFGGYLFDENGLEMEQMLDKGLFGAALYNHAISLMQGAMTPATVDQLLAIYGAHPDFPNTPTATKAKNPDRAMANYAARRDKNNGNGLYSQIKNDFLKLQAALKAGANYNTERDEALVSLRLNWEKVNAATVINYCHAVTSIMSATTTTDADKGRALHAYGECVGFLHGWRTLPEAFKQLTDREIDELLVLLNAPQNAAPTAYKFATEPVTQLPKLAQVIDRLKAKFNFSTQDVEDFKKNWVAEQGR